MHFGTKSYLKSNRNRTAKQTHNNKEVNATSFVKYSKPFFHALYIYQRQAA